LRHQKLQHVFECPTVVLPLVDDDT